jgi:exoribonuclease-2
MFPWELTRERLSLEAGVERRVVSLVARVTAEGRARSPFELCLGIARVDRRLTYEEALHETGDWRRPLEVIAGVARALREARRARGALILDLPDLKVTLDESREPEVSLRRADTTSHLVVSELMVLYNGAVAARLAETGTPALFRQQGEAARVTVEKEDPLFPVRARRGLPQTAVAVEPGPHRTMGLDAYVQASSPIRRYGDLVAQRQLAALIRGDRVPHARQELEELRGDLERAERTARRIEAERELYWVCRWLERRAGEVFEGVVSRSAGAGPGLVFLPELAIELPLAGPPRDEGERVRVKVRNVVPRKRVAVMEGVEANEKKE